MRKTILAIAVSFLISGCLSAPMSEAERAPHCMSPQSDTDSAREVFVFAFPLYEMYRMRQRALSPEGAEANRLQHRNRLSGLEDRYITTPNRDTLYSQAWLDLADGPVRFSIPVMGDRYHSAHLMNAFSDTFAVLRNEASITRVFLIVGPDWEGQANADETLIRSPTRDAWLVLRTHAGSDADLTEAQRLQLAYGLEGNTTSTRDIDFEARIPTHPNGDEFRSVVDAALRRGPVPLAQSERLDCFLTAGIGQDFFGEADVSDVSIIQSLDAHIGQFYRETQIVFEQSGQLVDGWRYPPPNIGAFGEDDTYRSAMALGGLAAMPIEEATNPMTNVDADGQKLDGQSNYRLSIPGNVPVDGFWSLTLYESDGAGRWFFYPNAIDRYAVSSTSEELKREEDGSIILEISHENRSNFENWMPAPRGDFRLVFRAYRPRSEFRNGAFRLPAVERQ